MKKYLASLVLMVAGCHIPFAMPQEQTFSGEVTERMESGGYVYLNIDTGSGLKWVATGISQAQVGDAAAVNGSWKMTDFKSTSLDRVFEEIYFSQSVTVESAEGAVAPVALPDSHPDITKSILEQHHGGATAPNDWSDISIKIPENGKTIQDCMDKKDSLEGQAVIIRGVVVKYSPKILGKNWIHLMDGTESGDDSRLVVTTSGETAVGNVVLATGKLKKDVDLGFGYLYKVLIEDAEIVDEGKYNK